jgi:hypothetical protein
MPSSTLWPLTTHSSSISQSRSNWSHLFHKLIHSLQNTAQYDAYLNTISIYLWLPERFYRAFFTIPLQWGAQHDAYLNTISIYL